MSKTSSAFIFCIAISICGYSQIDSSKHYVVDLTKELSLLTAIDVGKYVNAEVGIGINSFGTVGPHPSGVCYYLGNEIKVSDKLLIGPKVGIHFIGGLAFGFSFIYYTDFDSGCIAFRPDIGIGFERFKMAYGYNAKLSNKHFNGINTHLFTVIYLFRLKHLGVIRR